MLSNLRKDPTATAALTRPVAIRHAKEGRRSPLRAAVAATYSSQTKSHFGGNCFGSQPGACRMPSLTSTLDPSQPEEGRP